MAMAWKFVHDKPISYAAWYLQQEKEPHSAWSLELLTTGVKEQQWQQYSCH
jgi:hypothetical protein